MSDFNVQSYVLWNTSFKELSLTDKTLGKLGAKGIIEKIPKT